MNATWLWFAVGATWLAVGGGFVNSLAESYKMPQLLWCTGLLWLAALLMGWQASADFWLTWRQQDAWILTERQRALAMTPQTVLSENMRQMHPSAIDVLKLYGRMTWMILPGAEPDSQVEWVLYGTQCTYDFIGAFLEESNDTSCVPEWKFANDGAKLYAPKGMKENWCTDREQYQQFIAFLYGLGRVTKAFGNQPAAWVGPWNPLNVGKTMAIRFDEDEGQGQALPLL